jgi:hypothetical protein
LLENRQKEALLEAGVVLNPDKLQQSTAIAQNNGKLTYFNQSQF